MRGVTLLAILALWSALACVSPPPPVSYRLFEPLPEDDVFAPAIGRWQAETRLEELAVELAGLRASLDADGTPPQPAPEPAGASALGLAYREFRSSLRQRVASDTLRWVQQQSGLYYRKDAGSDDWPVLRELLETGFDDCDGMDLLTFSLLRQLGFGRGEIYRAIVRNVETDRHHIVTLWFESGPDSDPWLLDSTGEISRAVIRLSAQRDWEPLRLFDEKTAFRVGSVDVAE